MVEMCKACLLVVLLLISTFLLSGCQAQSNKDEAKYDGINKTDRIESDTLDQNYDSQINAGSWEEDFKHSQKEGLEFEQLEIPLNNNSGIPFYQDQLGVYIEGFDIDNQGDFYFAGGAEETWITRFSKEKMLYRLSIGTVRPGGIKIINDSVIVVIDLDDNKNDLIWIDKREGKVLSTFTHIIDNQINSCYFSDTHLMLEVFNVVDSLTMGTELSCLKFNFQGELSGFARNLFDTPNEIIKSGIDSEGVSGNWVLGTWKNRYVKLVDYKGKMHFLLLNDDGTSIVDKSIRNSELIEYYLLGSYYEHYLMSNDKIFILGQKGDNAVITILPLDKLFEIK